MRYLVGEVGRSVGEGSCLLGEVGSSVGEGKGIVPAGVEDGPGFAEGFGVGCSGEGVGGGGGGRSNETLFFGGGGSTLTRFVGGGGWSSLAGFFGGRGISGCETRRRKGKVGLDLTDGVMMGNMNEAKSKLSLASDRVRSTFRRPQSLASIFCAGRGTSMERFG